MPARKQIVRLMALWGDACPVKDAGEPLPRAPAAFPSGPTGPAPRCVLEPVAA